MKFNLLETGYLTVSGTVYLSLEDMSYILSASGTVTVSGSGGDNITFYGDIVDRISIDQIRYYFTSAASSSTVASGIHFYYKDDAADSYINLTTNIGEGYYYAIVPGLSAPRYIMLNHTLSGTSIIGQIVGFKVLNDDSVVDFGTDGTKTMDTTMTSLNYLNYSDYIKEIPVYNSGDTTATAHIFLEPQYEDVDELISISDSEDGPWVQARNVNYIISNGDNWDAGQYNNTSTSEIADGKLRISSGQTVGTYTTPIFKNDTVRFAYIDMLQTAVSGSIVAVDSDDYISTIQIRSSSTKPIDYNVYRKFMAVLPSPGPVHYYYRDYLLSTDTLVFDSYVENGDYFADDFSSGTYTYYRKLVVCSINVNGECVFLHVWSGSSGRGGIELFLLYNNGLLKASKDLKNNFNASNGYKTYFIELDSDMNIWLYVYFPDVSYLGPAGYYLLHYNSVFTLLYSEYSSSNFIAGCDTVKDSSGALWYSRITGTQAIIKISSTGEILVTYDSVLDVGRLCATEDGGCWFIDGNVLYKLDSDGVLEDSITNLEIAYDLTWVITDKSDSNFLWIVDGAYIKLISLDGRVYRSIYFEGFTIIRMHSNTEYLTVYCYETSTSNYSTKIIGRAAGGIVKTLMEDTMPYNPGMNVVSYDNPILGDIIPLSDDPIWNDDLEWNKAVTENAILPREEYNQLKLTLRRPSVDIDSPTVENIYYQDNVELSDIYPGQSKTLYLKISLPDGMTILGSYESMLKVWWEVSI